MTVRADELALLLRVLPALRQGDGGVGLDAGCPQFVGDARHLLRALAEDVPLHLLDGGLDRSELLAQLRQCLALLLDRLGLRGDGCLSDGELGRQALDLLAPLALMVAATHRQL